MSIFGDALGAVKGGLEDGYKLVTDSHYRDQVWNSAVDDAKTAANVVSTPVRAVDAAKDQVGSWIDSGEKYLDNKVDDARAWLSQHGGVAGQVASDWIGVNQGVAESLYGAGKGLVQLANGAASLADPIEWAANPGANIARVKSAVGTAAALGKIAGLADPGTWIANPQGNEQLAGALWHSAATSFDKDPSKFVGNVAGTIGTLFIPGAGEAGAVGDAGRMAELATDASKVVNLAEDTRRATTVAQDAGEAGGAAAAAEGAARAADPGKALMLPPVKIEFPANGLTPEQQALFRAHLAEQEIHLNGLSLSRPSDLRLNLENYPYVSRELTRARAAARGYLPGSGTGQDAAHGLDAVAGGYLHDFVGFRDAATNQRIGSLWRTRSSQIVPGRVHQLLPIFDGVKPTP